MPLPSSESAVNKRLELLTVSVSLAVFVIVTCTTAADVMRTWRS